MRTFTLVLVAAAALSACSGSPTDPCVPGGGPLPGAPGFDLAASLRVAGAEVAELGQRLDQTLLSVPTEVLRVNGEEVLQWRYCSGDLLARDLGLYGVGVRARTPPVVELDPEDHLFAMARVVAFYHGTTAELLALLEQVMGSQVAPRPSS